MDKLEGAYSLVIMSPSKLIAARDKHGFRPLCYGQKDRLTNYKLTEKVAAKYSLDHHRFDGAGHLINYERAEQVANEIRRFLTK